MVQEKSHPPCAQGAKALGATRRALHPSGLRLSKLHLRVEGQAVFQQILRQLREAQGENGICGLLQDLARQLDRPISSPFSLQTGFKQLGKQPPLELTSKKRSSRIEARTCHFGMYT